MLLCKFLHEPYFKCSPTLFSSLLGGNLHSCMANKNPLARAVLRGFPPLAASTCPALWYEIIKPKIVSTGPFSPGLTWRWGLLALVQVFHSKRRGQRPNTCKYLHNLVMDSVWSVAVKLVGDFLRRETFSPHHWKMLICWKGKHSWTRNWGCRSSFFHERWAGSLASLSPGGVLASNCRVMQKGLETV